MLSAWPWAGSTKVHLQHKSCGMVHSLDHVLVKTVSDQVSNSQLLQNPVISQTSFYDDLFQNSQKHLLLCCPASLVLPGILLFHLLQQISLVLQAHPRSERSQGFHWKTKAGRQFPKLKSRTKTSKMLQFAAISIIYTKSFKSPFFSCFSHFARSARSLSLAFCSALAPCSPQRAFLPSTRWWKESFGVNNERTNGSSRTASN